MNPTLEHRLVVQTRQHNVTSYHALVTGHMGLVFTLARQLAETCGPESEFSELMSEGQLALCESAQDFCDKQPSCRFSTFAFRRIRGAMISHLRTAGPVRATEWKARAAQSARRNFDGANRRFSQEGFAPPTLDEFSSVFGDHQGRALSEGGRVPLELADGYPEMQVQPEPGTPFHERFAALPAPTRQLIGQLTDGATLGQLAVSWATPRHELRLRLIEGYKAICH